jgi:WG repeat protein
MRKAAACLCYILLCALLSASSFACEWDYLIWIPRSPNADPLYRFLKGQKSEYIDKTGKVVIPATLPHFRNNSGEEFHDGLLEMGVSDGIYLNTLGKKVIDKGLYRGWDFSDGLAAAVKGENGKWGYINTKGDWAITPRFAWSTMDYVSAFENGFASIEIAGKYGYIDHSGEFTISPKFYLADSFHEGFARVVAEGPCLYTDRESPCADFRVLPPGTATPDSLPQCKLTFIDTKGRIISENRFDDAKPFSEGMAPVRIGELWGYIDKLG